MAVNVSSTTLLGVNAYKVIVEIEIISALRRFVIVGLPDGVLREAKDRVRCAIENSGFGFPSGEIIVSLTPASLPKQGAGFDLAIAAGILAAQGLLDPSYFAERLILGELNLDGKVKAVPGVLASACYARSVGIKELIVPAASSCPACMIEEVKVVPVTSLMELMAYLTNKKAISPVAPPKECSEIDYNKSGFGDVVGQHTVKRALEIAAAGGHNVLMLGPPGSGKTMLAKRIISILPPLNREEMIEISRIYAAGNLLGQDLPDSGEVSGEKGWRMRRPFRIPHHSSSLAGLIGGGSMPVPGEISLAHRGVLFLDEFVELRRDVIESLREPLESRSIVISRAKMRLKFPADFILIAAMNPCPCGKRGISAQASSGGGKCLCSEQAVKRYVARLSGPIVDRIDLQIWVSPVPLAELSQEVTDDPTERMRNLVHAARKIQETRFQSSETLNSSMNSVELKIHCRTDKKSMALLEIAANKFGLSARSYTRILKVARTIADLNGSENIESIHVSEALSYRMNIGQLFK